MSNGDDEEILNFIKQLTVVKWEAFYLASGDASVVREGLSFSLKKASLLCSIYYFRITRKT